MHSLPHARIVREEGKRFNYAGGKGYRWSRPMISARSEWTLSAGQSGATSTACPDCALFVTASVNSM